MYSASMLKNRCVGLPCRKPYVTSCQKWKSGPPVPGVHNAKDASSMLPATCCSRKIKTFTMIRACVTGGIANIDFGVQTLEAPVAVEKFEGDAAARALCARTSDGSARK